MAKTAPQKTIPPALNLDEIIQRQNALIATLSEIIRAVAKAQNVSEQDLVRARDWVSEQLGPKTLKRVGFDPSTTAADLLTKGAE